MASKFDLQTIYAEIDERAKKLGISMQELCDNAGLARSTLDRMRNGLHEPTLATLRKLDQALDALEGKRRVAASRTSS